jgi:enoyl-CoA hydratase/carnithine racemase
VDLDHMHEQGTARPALGESFSALIEVLVRLRKPLIGSVHGLAVGFGATVLLHCDVVLLAEGTRLRFPFTSLATTPEAGSTVLLAEAVGAQHAAELLYTARWIEADEAVSLGLAARCCEPQRLGDETRELAATIAAQPAPAVKAAKRLLRAGRADTVLAAVEREFDEARRLGELLGPLRRP